MTKFEKAIADAGYTKKEFATIIGIRDANLFGYFYNPEKIKKMRVKLAMKTAITLNISLEELLKMGDE